MKPPKIDFLRSPTQQTTDDDDVHHPYHGRRLIFPKPPTTDKQTNKQPTNRNNGQISPKPRHRPLLGPNPRLPLQRHCQIPHLSPNMHRHRLLPHRQTSQDEPPREEEMPQDHFEMQRSSGEPGHVQEVCCAESECDQCH